MRLVPPKLRAEPRLSLAVLIAVQSVTVLLTLILALLDLLTWSESVLLAAIFIVIENVSAMLVQNRHLEEIVKSMQESQEHAGQRLDTLEGNALPLRHVQLSLDQALVRRQYQDVTRRYQAALGDLASKHFRVEFSQNKIAEESFVQIRAINREAFATVLVKEFDWVVLGRGGNQHDFMEACIEAARRIKAGGKGRFVRVFIIEGLDEIDRRVFEALEDHQANGIDVYIATMEQMRQRGLKLADFGLWDDCLMLVRRPSDSAEADGATERGLRKAVLDIYFDDHEEVDKYRKLRDELLSSGIAKSWAEFKQQLWQPVNTEWRTLLPAQNYKLPAPIGPSDSDVEKMCETAGAVSGRRVLVLGYTARLVERLKQKGCDVDVLDINSYTVDYPIQSGNWLTWHSDKPYDAAIGDDVLCNLGSWQYHQFFRNVAKLLNPNGKLVTRALAFYFEPNGGAPPASDIDERLSEADDKNMNVAEHYVLMYTEMALSDKFYETGSKSFHLGSWNKYVNDRGWHRLPFQFPVRQTVLFEKEIDDAAAPWFQLAGARQLVDSAYAQLDPRFNQLYRIVAYARTACPAVTGTV